MEQRDPGHSPLLSDLYELTMLQAYRASGMNDTAVLEMFVRALPPGRNFLLAAGLEQLSSAFTANVVNDVLNAVIFGPEAYAFGDWGSVQTYFTEPGGLTDPLHQITKIGWKGMFGAVIMGEGTNATNVTPARYRRIEHTSQL